MAKSTLTSFIAGLVLLLRPAWAADTADTQPASTRNLILRPADGPGLRIDFDYRFSNALPPFEKEPEFPGKEIARGLIPTFPPTPFIRNITDNRLLLNEDHSRDFLGGRSTVYASTYHGHVIFEGLRVFTDRAGLTIPYRVDLLTYEHACSGWIQVRSAWASALNLDGREWLLGVVDNLDGRIDDRDTLYLRAVRETPAEPILTIERLPKTLFLSGRSFDLGFTFKNAASDVILEATLTETRPPLGTLILDTDGSKYLLLENNNAAIVLDATEHTALLPVGEYRLADCVLARLPGQAANPKFESSDQTFSVSEGHSTILRAGLPLANTVRVSRDRNLLHLSYQAIGVGGERYRCYDINNPPQFNIHKGSVSLAEGTLPFG